MFRVRIRMLEYGKPKKLRTQVGNYKHTYQGVKCEHALEDKICDAENDVPKDESGSLNFEFVFAFRFWLWYEDVILLCTCHG